MTRKQFKLIVKELIVAIILVTAIISVNVVKTFAAHFEYDEAIEAEVLVVEEATEAVVISDEPQIISEIQKSASTFVVDYNINSADADAWSGNSYDEEDYEYLVMLLTGECQTCSYEEQLLYGAVALNRVAHNEFPDTIKEVCLDKHYGIQYACFYDGNAYREATETSKRVAKDLLTNGTSVPTNVIYQAQFKQGSGVYAVIGNTYFCYE